MDARQALEALSPATINVLITDPPYETVDRHGGRTDFLRGWFKGGMSWVEIGRLLRLARSRMTFDGIAFVMANPDGLRPAIEALEGAGFRVRPIAWDKTFPSIGMGLRHQTEYVLAGLQPQSRTLTGLDILRVKAVGAGTAGRYPTQKPEQLGRVLARMTGVRRGDVVMDPFCGSGSLLVGAKERGATVLGSDISKEAIANAARRLAR